MTHKFKARQSVTLAAVATTGTGRNARFEIVRLLPEERGINHYRIKSVIDGHERVVTEGELS